MRLPHRLLPALVFALAALAALAAGTWLATAAERLTRAELDRAFAAAGIGWVTARVDGLGAHLTGRAPDEGARLAALRTAAEVVGAGRLSADIVVPPAPGLVAPVFRIEAMRNHDDLSVVGLTPAPAEAETESLLRELAAIGPGIEVADMLQSADHPAPPGWGPGLAFAVAALSRLEVAQVSVSAGRIDVRALVDSPEARTRLTAELRDLAPRGQVVNLDLTAPRPVIAPFRLRLVRDAEGTRLETCAADTEAARAAIERAARAAGLTGRFACTLALGAPSPRWGQAAELAIAAVARIGAAELTMTDLTVALQAPHDTDRAAFDRAIGRLEADLPPAFTVEAGILPAPEAEAAAAPERPRLLAVIDDQGAVTISGRLPDARVRDMVAAYAAARFGTRAVTLEARLDPDLPPGWGNRVLAGLEALTQIHHGQLTVTEARIELTGTTGNPDAGTEVAQRLAARLGAEAGVTLRLTYDEALDPVAQEPTPERCEAWVRQVLAERKITFAPGSARFDRDAVAALDRIAEVLRGCGELPLEVSGHTDSQGRDEINLTLSQVRAEAVVTALSERGVLTGAMVAQGYGSSRPVAGNDTEDGREANRRIEFALIRPAADPATLEPAERAELEAALEIAVGTPAAGQTRPPARPDRSD